MYARPTQPYFSACHPSLCPCSLAPASVSSEGRKQGGRGHTLTSCCRSCRCPSPIIWLQCLDCPLVILLLTRRQTSSSWRTSHICERDSLVSPGASSPREPPRPHTCRVTGSAPHPRMHHSPNPAFSRLPNSLGTNLLSLDDNPNVTLSKTPSLINPGQILLHMGL